MFLGRLCSMLMVLTVLAGCRVGAQNETGSRAGLPAWAQCQASNSEHNPCQASMYSLVTSPSLYDGMYVEFIGYFDSRGSRLLFVSRDAAASSDYLSSLLMESTFDDPAGYYQVDAKFAHDVQDSGLASGVQRQVGRLTSIRLTRVGTSIDTLSEKCGDDSCEAYFINGVAPAVREKALAPPPQ